MGSNGTARMERNCRSLSRNRLEWDKRTRRSLQVRHPLLDFCLFFMVTFLLSSAICIVTEPTTTDWVP